MPPTIACAKRSSACVKRKRVPDSPISPWVRRRASVQTCAALAVLPMLPSWMMPTISMWPMRMANTPSWMQMACRSGASTIALGADAVQVTRALASFKPLEHRIEPAGEAQGVSFYNDSKATNVDATLVALTAFPGRPLIVMLGGHDKLGPLDELVDACEEHGKAVVVFGEAKERFEAAFREGIDGSQSSLHLLQADTFDEAFAQAVHVARAGDVVLLSPACASFDEFTCFEERGQHFKDLVRALGRADA